MFFWRSSLATVNLTQFSTSFMSSPRSRLSSIGKQLKNTTATATRQFSNSSRNMAPIKYKLVDIPSAQALKPGEMKESAVEGVKDAKVLVANNGGNLHALSPRCTHYGAPLANGVLSSNGTLTCPWHGACYKLTTGDVEDSPALNSLKTYDLSSTDDGLFITVDDKDPYAFPQKGVIRTPSRRVKNPSERTIIIGAGSGATGVLESLVNNGYEGGITLISAPDQTYPIDRTKLSKALLTDEDTLSLRPKEWYRDNEIDVILSEWVKKVDLQHKYVYTESGKKYEYTKVVVATGGKPRMLPLPGFTPENAHLLRSIRDAKKIISSLGDSKKDVVVIGSSFIGMEVANCISQKGANVTVIGTQAAPMDHIMGEKVGRIFQKLLEKSGVKFQMNAEVQKLTVDGDVRYVHIKGAKKPLKADVVVVGTGVKPGTEPLAGAVDLLEDGSVKVDKHYQIEGAVDAYAIGDIATFPYWGPGSGQNGGKSTTRIEHWDVAQNQGRAAADHIIHQDKGSKVDLPPKRFVPVFWSALGAQLRYCGTTINGYDDVVLKGDPDNAKFVAYYTLGEVVVAVASMQSDPVVMKCVNLMKAGKMPGKSAIKDGVDVLKIEV